jgi:hypothetical protein
MWNVRAYAPVDTDGRVMWAFLSPDVAGASVYAEHPKRRVVEVGVIHTVRKVKRKAKRKAKRGKHD